MKSYIKGLFLAVALLSPVKGWAVSGLPDAVTGEVARRINEARLREDKGTLTWDNRLGAACQEHALNMAAHKAALSELDGKNAADRILEHGYNYRVYAESIYNGQGYPNWTPEAAVDWLLSMRGEREKLLAFKFLSIGVGVAADSDGRFYFCIDVASIGRRID